MPTEKMEDGDTTLELHGHHQHSLVQGAVAALLLMLMQ